MSSSSQPVVRDFFNNKVTILLKNGHKFQGLLGEINYKNEFIILVQVQDLGNATDKAFIPHDKKIEQKVFQCENIDEIIMKDKHFCEPKKYKKDDFWDSVSEPVPSNQQKGNYRGGDKKKYYEKGSYNNNRDRDRDNNRDRDGNRGNYRGGGNNRNYEQRRDNRDRNYRDRERDHDKGNYDNNDNFYDRKKGKKQEREQQSTNNDREYR